MADATAAELADQSGLPFGPQAQAWLAQALGASAQRFDVTPLKGSTSSSVYLVWGGQPERSVLRVLDNAAWLAEEPDLAAHEAAALSEAEAAGLKAPRLLAYSAVEVGFGAPVVLMSFVPGSLVLRPASFPDWLMGLAGELALIHRNRAPALAWRFESWVNRAALAAPGWTSNSRAWERAIEHVLAGQPDFPPVFIHRDYHPMNVLWQAGAVSGVVDWINACRGPAGVDVAHCRTNLAQMYGPETADQFLAAYAEAAPEFRYAPYWDLDSLLDMSLPDLGIYPPWLEFGLDSLTVGLLRQRVDAYLESVLARM